MAFFEKIKEGLKKTKESMMKQVELVINSFTKIDEDFFEELEETLIMSDIGVTTSSKICDELRKKVKEKGLTDTKEIKQTLKEIITDMLGVGSIKHASVERAMASACPRSSAPIPGYAPAVSTKVMTGRSNRLASSINRTALR